MVGVPFIAVQTVGPQISRIMAADTGIEIQISIAIVVGEGGTVPLAQVVHTRSFTYVDEPVPPIVIEDVGLKAMHNRPSIGQVDIEPAVVVHVSETSAHGTEVTV